MGYPLGMFSTSLSDCPRLTPSSSPYKQRYKDLSCCPFPLVHMFKLPWFKPLHRYHFLYHSLKNVWLTALCLLTTVSNCCWILSQFNFGAWNVEIRSSEGLCFTLYTVLKWTIISSWRFYHKETSLCEEFSSLMCLYWITPLHLIILI